MKHLVVVVVDPKLGPVEGNLRALNDERCPHLIGDVPGEYSCAVHDEEWYCETPCFAHGQIERSPDEPCRLGKYIIERANRD